MNGVHVHVTSDDGMVSGWVFQVRIGHEATGLATMRNALNRLAKKRGASNRRPDPLGIFLADEILQELAPEEGLAALHMQVLREQADGKPYCDELLEILDAIENEEKG